MLDTPGVVPSPKSSAPLWFERLDVEAARQFRPEPSTPRGGDDLLETLAVAFERVTVVPLSAFLLFGSPRTLVRGLRAPGGLTDEWSYYADPVLLTNPAQMFPEPPAPEEPERHRPDRTLFSPEGADICDISFPSTFEPLNTVLRDEYLADVTNRVVHARWWRHSDGPPRPTLLSVHGFQAGQHALNTVLFDLPWIFEQGLDVVQFVLPYHGARAGAVDGWHFMSLDVARMAEAIAHSVWDLRATIRFLRDAGAPAVGLTGVSLGGYLVSLLAGLEAELSFVVPLAPAASLADLVADLAPLGPLMPRLLSQVGWDLEAMRRHMAVHTPVQHPPLLPPERLLVVGAVADRITPPYHQRLLWQHWGEPETFWHRGSHQFHLHRREFREVLRTFLDRCGVLT